MSVTHSNECMRQIVSSPGHVDVASLHILRRRDIWVEGEGEGEGEFHLRLVRVREGGQE